MVATTEPTAEAPKAERGPMILRWSPRNPSGEIVVDRPVLATGCRLPQNLPPVASVEAERNQRWPVQLTRAQRAGLPGYPRLRCPTSRPGRAELRTFARRDPDSCIRTVRRTKAKGGQAAREALGALVHHGLVVAALPVVAKGKRTRYPLALVNGADMHGGAA